MIRFRLEQRIRHTYHRTQLMLGVLAAIVRSRRVAQRSSVVAVKIRNDDEHKWRANVSSALCTDGSKNVERTCILPHDDQDQYD